MMPSVVNIELTSRCNANCWFCGRRKMEREHPELCDWGDMEWPMVHLLACQVPPGTLVQFHNSGEPTLYPLLGHALRVFPHCIRQFDSNGKLIVEKAGEIIGNLEVLTISVCQGEETKEQYETVVKFLERKGDRKPRLVYRLLGKVENVGRWQELPGLVATRTLHDPRGSFDYQKTPTVPEHGTCLDLLSHLAVDRRGWISVCVRFDPGGKLRLGNVRDMTLEEAFNGDKRQDYLQKHIEGRRGECPGCDRCHFYGVPTG